ncbi:CAP-Gly domain [Popillia japonica]|uniref:CAP-Gly domain n=1 Tax=Popillia japonica TaxID=7064 RepID=A0AAW1MXK2_POPJA
MDFGISTAGNESCVDTVRALHQTIIALRAALERSRTEILELKSKNWPAVDNVAEDAIRNLSIENSKNWPAVDNVAEDAIRNLSIENHVLRQKVINSEANTEENLRKDSKQKKEANTEENLRKDSKQKKIKFKENKEQVSHKQSELSKENTKSISKKNTWRSLENIANVSKQDQNQTKLTKSKTVCFSNVFEGDKQISTTNCLYFNDKRDKLKTANNNVNFTEEPVTDIVTASRHGSITDFKSKDFENVNKYTDCVLKTEKVIKSVRKNKEKPGKPRQSEHKNHTKQQRQDAKHLNEKNLVRRKSVVREAVEATLTGHYSVEEQELLEVTAYQTMEEQELLEVTAYQTSIVQENRSDLNSVKENAQKVNEESPLKVTKSCDESEEKTAINIDEEIAVALDLETNKSIEVVQPASKKVGEITNNDEDVKLIDNNGTATESPLNPGENGTVDTLNSSSPSSSQKNIEISVKIFKSSKKPIEIDIQTKKKRNNDKQSKMNNKSQNTSFDKEYGEVRTNQMATNEIRRHIDSATANNIVTNMLQNDVEQEVDDIELIFTTDDTKDTDFKEELVPIDAYNETHLLQCPLSDYEELVPIDAYNETHLLQCPLSDYEEKLSAEAMEDDVFNDNFENENQENCNFQSQTYDFRRENSQIYNSKSDNSINHEDKSLRSYYSYQDSSFENKSLEKDESFDRFEEKTRIVETDMSKIGIQDVEFNMGRRNTCPNPIQYRPIMHREALGRGLSSSRKCRPILAHSNVVRKESGAQTDISALPGSSWRSESSLGYKVKVGENFTTLPSKFPHPGSRLRLSEKTVEARRVLLSDIGFTSMVPELSRSADHLCPPVVRGPVVSSYGQFLRTTDLYSPAYTSQKFVWTTTTPSEGSHSQSRYSSQYPLSSPPVPTRRCSAPVSPSKKTTVMKSTPSKVRFANGSLPELRGDWTATVDSGESTDSLVEEAEHFLRRSIDCLAPCKDVCFRSETVKVTGVRRASAPEPSRDNVPPQGWQPFLPRIPRDLHLDYWVKVISPEGRVRGGRVRYVGPLMNQPEAFVGVQLSTPDGHSDGTYNSRRYFNCEPYHGLFVPFKKIIMGWRP